MTSGSGPGTVSVLAYDGMTAFEAGIVIEVFGLHWSDLDLPWYDLRVCAEGDAPLRVLGGATLSTPYGLADFAAADTVVVPSVKDPSGPVSDDLIAALQSAHARGARLVSICSGAFALAAAGLLDGRRATTHWRYADQLQCRYPDVLVDPDPLYVEDDNVLTSAGCAAGLDLALHIVRSDLGASVANAVARRMVVSPHRPGGQSQYIEAPMAVDPEDERLAASLAWAQEHLDQPIRLGDLAARAAMSSRTYQRKFSAATGTSPAQWLIERRVQRAVELLETTDLPIEYVGAATGFATPATMRHHFTARVGTSPSAYRRTFKAEPIRRR
ncbi:helix-turn-helix domain-containing protein [Luteipulveratus mongoliensis]|uniref:AraC family transcriptional regulator n=1 Tax=Luteipulveratus mongoliensis TaxID=571913 RepID=A0A0K1JKU4_9MICO|nr:helix-turn-helix domain-containing protein [Luteipulveratus mongoliensis]AKU17337.1 AraC family transcriptional regulator [Luteipulveratus mongoliensis]